MRLFDEGFFMSHLEIEIEKSKRYGYPFTLVMVETVDQKQVSGILLHAILEANYRSVDVVARLDGHRYVLLMNHTSEEGASKWVSRIINVAVRDRNIPISTAITGYKNGDHKQHMMERLYNQLN